MIGSFRQSMTWLHTWAGLLFCWVLYFMFVTGTLGYFDAEIDHWMNPEKAPAQSVPLNQSLEVSLKRLGEEAEGADRWLITLPGGREVPHLKIFWQGPEPEEEWEKRRRGNEELNALTGEPLAEEGRDTGGGQVLYRMHYALHYVDRRIAFRFIGVVTMLMFVGLMTGIVVHKKIFKDFFTFRPARGRRSWLDAHNLLSVSSLPFQLMITYSGLLFTVTTWMPMIALGNYGFDTKKASAELGAIANLQVERAGTPAELTDINAIVAEAEAAWGEGQIRSVDIRVPGDAHARVLVNRVQVFGALGEQQVYDGVSGEYLETLDPTSRAPVAVASVLIGLHEGLYAGPLLRWLYFFSGLLGAGMVATGAIYWTAKRRKKVPEKDQPRGFRFVEKLNIGTILGLPIGIAAYFWANRLLPLELSGRAEWEVHSLFIVWTLCLLYPLVRPHRAAWHELAWIAAILFGALPIGNALTTDAHFLNSLHRGDQVMAAFDMTALVFGLLLAILATVIGRERANARRPSAKILQEVSIS